MWISRKEYQFLKENAEKNIDAECEILKAKENQTRAVSRAMEEYSASLEEIDKLRLRLAQLESWIKENVEFKEGETKIGYWEHGDMYGIGDVDSVFEYFEHIKKCLNDYETVMNGENAKQGYLSEDEEDIVAYFEFHLARALMKEPDVNAEKIAKFILVAKGLSGDIRVK